MAGKLKKIGLVIIGVLLLLCFIEIKKEAVAASCYEAILYQANGQGAWLKYGRYQPNSVYQKMLDGIPLLHFARQEQIESIQKQEMDTTEEEEFEDDSTDTYEIAKTIEEEQENLIAQGDSYEENKIGEPLLHIAYSHGEIAKKNQTMDDTTLKPSSIGSLFADISAKYQWNESSENTKFIKTYYIADPSVGEVSGVIDAEELLSLDTSLNQITEEPQILIYHTHGSETYANSKSGVEEDTVVGMGEILCEELTARGFSVLHDRTMYDRIDGKDTYNSAYTTARAAVEATLEQYPSIEVILDIHRDIGEARRTVIDGEKTAQIMLFNGLCRNQNGPIADLENEYLTENLAFSLQLNLLGRERCPGLMYRIYLKNYRYNMHFREHCMLVELGTEGNTVEEAQNAIKRMAPLLSELLTEKSK